MGRPKPLMLSKMACMVLLMMGIPQVVLGTQNLDSQELLMIFKSAEQVFQKTFFKTMVGTLLSDQGSTLRTTLPKQCPLTKQGWLPEIFGF